MTLRTDDTFVRRSFAALTLLCVAGSATSSLWNHPHSLAYFNEASGGPANGYKHLLHSSLDWGQDLYLVKQWMADRGIERNDVDLLPEAFCPCRTLIVDSHSSHHVWEIVSAETFLKSRDTHRGEYASVDRIGYSLWAIRRTDRGLMGGGNEL